MAVTIHLFLFFSLGLAFVSLSKCDLEAILVDSRLPTPLSAATSIYDGDDSIYIFGGFVSAGNTSAAIHRYEISTDTIFTSVASFPHGRYGGGISSDSTGNIFYYGGANNTVSTPLSNVFKFNLVNLNLNEVADLGSKFSYGSVITHSNAPNIVYLIGGKYDSNIQQIYCFNMTSVTGCGETELAGAALAEQSSAFAYEENAFVFCRSYSGFLVLDINTLQSHVEINTLPNFSSRPNFVTDGNYGYLIGGWNNSTSTPMKSIIKFDPETFSHEFINVKNHPVLNNGATSFILTSTVYVDKLNRIYVIGGTSSSGSPNSHRHDEMWYIDLLTPTDPTTPNSTTAAPPESSTSSSSTPTPNGNCTEDGIYFVPCPGDCSKYMVCFHFNLLPEVQQCAPNTLFDPLLGECNDEHLVPCEPICPNNNTLIYIPHRNSCSLYWLCVWGEIELRICPENMVFDPQMNSCNYKEFVFCPNLCPTDTPIANFPHESDCSNYWHCVNGNPTLISCPDGQLYDPALGQCSRDQEECAISL